MADLTRHGFVSIISPYVDNPAETAMTGSARSLCDCPESCACYAEGYAAGKDKAYFEVIASLEGPPHAGECACQPCQVKWACLQKVIHGPALSGALRAGGGLDLGGPG